MFLIIISPHPGNLLRTTDGRLCVLDWGMTLEVPKDLQYGLLDFIAHINAEDFESLPEDFVNLGFTPPNKLEQVKRFILNRFISNVLWHDIRLQMNFIACDDYVYLFIYIFIYQFIHSSVSPFSTL